MNYPWKTKRESNRRFPPGFDGNTREEITTIYINGQAEDFINDDNWTQQDMILHLIDKTQESRIEIFSSTGISYEKNDKGLWDILEWGDSSGSSFYYYSPETGLSLEED